jgi:hypothetical protein
MSPYDLAGCGGAYQAAQWRGRGGAGLDLAAWGREPTWQDPPFGGRSKGGLPLEGRAHPPLPNAPIGLSLISPPHSSGSLLPPYVQSLSSLQ